MDAINPIHPDRCRVLATDLDGTLIPLPGSEDHAVALHALRRARVEHPFLLIYATGRHYQSVRSVMHAEHLPEPDWIVCDVGTAIHVREGAGYPLFAPYEIHLNGIIGHVGRSVIEQLLSPSALTLQPPDHQQRFKISYACAPGALPAAVDMVSGLLRSAKVPYHVIGSMDPFADRGLIDVLPEGVSKAYALQWLARHAGYQHRDVVYAGDSGNDLAALACGFRAVIVANADRTLVEQVRACLTGMNGESLLYAATGAATSGVLEGCRHFGLLP